MNDKSTGAKAVTDLAATHTIQQSELNRLVEQLHALRQALAPFANFAKSLPVVVPGEERLTDAGPIFYASVFRTDFVITCADLRKALSLLTELETGDTDRVIASVERKLAGVGDICTLCHEPIIGSEGHELRGFCSEKCEVGAWCVQDNEEAFANRFGDNDYGDDPAD